MSNGLRVRESKQAFNLKEMIESGVDLKKEVIGGITTFLTMAYIIAVNADI